MIHGGYVPTVSNQRFPISNICSICRKLVDLQTSETDENGQAVLEE
jgi:hypothetical protein